MAHSLPTKNIELMTISRQEELQVAGPILRILFPSNWELACAKQR